MTVEVKREGTIEAIYKCISVNNPVEYNLQRILIQNHPNGIKLAVTPEKFAPPQTTLNFYRQESNGKNVYDSVKADFNFAVRPETGQIYPATILGWLNAAQNETSDVLAVWYGLWMLMFALREEKERKHFE